VGNSNKPAKSRAEDWCSIELLLIWYWEKTQVAKT